MLMKLNLRDYKSNYQLYKLIFSLISIAFF